MPICGDTVTGLSAIHDTRFPVHFASDYAIYKQPMFIIFELLKMFSWVHNVIRTVITSFVIPINAKPTHPSLFYFDRICMD